MDYVFLGGAGEVGGSCMLLSVSDRHYLFDCGIRVNRTGAESLPDLKILKESAPTLDGIFVSHAHADHIGALPLAHAAFPKAPIYATEPTRRLGAVMLNNAVSLMESETDGSLFTQEAVEATLGKMRVFSVGSWHQLAEGIRVLFIRSGHILGAVCIYLETPDGTFFYSGDVSSFHQKTIDGLDTSLLRVSPDFMVCEGTYGDSVHPSRSVEEMNLAKSVAEVISDGGSVLIPSFALGRAQEIILILKQAMLSKVIPKFPVVTDGLVNSICSVYASMPEALGGKIQNYMKHAQQPLFFSEYIRAARMGEQEVILKEGVPKCIIASSGMLMGGASVTYAKGLCGDPKNAIFLSGYQDAESPGRRLQELESGDRLVFPDGVPSEVKCRVARFHLSAHSDQGQLVSFIKQVNPKSVALVHGEIDTLSQLRDKLMKAFPVLCPQNGQMLSATDNPVWLPPSTRERINRKIAVDFDVQITGNKMNLDISNLDADRWNDFCMGDHVATLKGEKLIIRKK